MTYSREVALKEAQGLVGLKASDTANFKKKILDVYNSQKKLPRGVKMKAGMSWCAATMSAIAIKIGYTKIMPVECSCGQLIEEAKKMGIWVEDDAYVPQPADYILYDWDDNGKGDCTGWPEHVGMVEKVNEDTGLLTVIEGNYSKQVKRRTIGINGRYIRGYITPKYDDQNTESVPKPKELIIAKEKAKSRDAKYVGTYVTTDKVPLRAGAGTSKEVLVTIPKGTKVINYSYYTKCGVIPWLYVTVTIKDVEYQGYLTTGNLKKP